MIEGHKSILNEFSAKQKKMEFIKLRINRFIPVAAEMATKAKIKTDKAIRFFILSVVTMFHFRSFLRAKMRKLKN